MIDLSGRFNARPGEGVSGKEIVKSRRIKWHEIRRGAQVKSMTRLKAKGGRGCNPHLAAAGDMEL